MLQEINNLKILLERKVKHPLYGKVMKRATKVHAHDENNSGAIGDQVTVKECRPFCKSKTWIVVEGDIQNLSEKAEVTGENE